MEQARIAMGSELRLSAWTDDGAAALVAFEDVFQEFDRLDRLLSVWHPQSDVSRVNRAADRNAVVVQPELLEILEIGRQVSAWTGGKFD